MPCKIKDPIILLERCDKIWETLKVIKNVQDKSKIDTLNTLPLEINSKPLYIQNQSPLKNSNVELPNFKFSIKYKKRLFHCLTCGKQYTENRRLRSHSEKVHGIYIPPKRKRYTVLYQKDNVKMKEKNSNIVEREVDCSEKVSLKKDENRLHVRTSLQSTSNDKKIISDLHLRRKKNINETICGKNEQEKKVLNKQFKQEKIISESHISLLTCILCKKTVNDIRKHLIDYHKIESPDFMLKNLNETSNHLKDKLKTGVLNDENKFFEIIENKKRVISNIQYSNSRKRYKVNNSKNLQVDENNTRQCDICLGRYKVSSFYTHMRYHRQRGETKENFHLFDNKYLNSPLYLKSKLNSNDISNENSNNNHSNKDDSISFKNKEKEWQTEDMQNKDNIKKKSNKNNICSCGRKFRNPHTLFVHKKKCTSIDGLKQPIIENKVNIRSQYVIQNNSDRNSEIGISITIKKKNNSYEIIDRSNKNKNKMQDSINSKYRNAKYINTSNISENNTQIELQDQLQDLKTSELSKYSERHSILKIQSADEDIDIDIEEDSQTNDFCKEKEEQNVKVEQDDNSCQKTINSEFLKKKILTKSNYKQSNGIKKNFTKKYNICVCGYKFYTKKALEIHTNKHHPNSNLICGYCKISFSNGITWNKHQCSVNEGKKFIDVRMEINCFHCTISFSSHKKFDDHIRQKHHDSVLPFQCFRCYKRFSSTSSRKIHFDTDHAITICSLCNNKIFDIMKSRHEAYHYGLGFPCHVCKRTYTTRESLLKHTKRCHKYHKISLIANNDLNV